MKPIPRWSRRKQARPAELTRAALELFVERGYAATRLEDVAKRAGVSKGTLYLYFDSKEELFKAVVREGLVPAWSGASGWSRSTAARPPISCESWREGWWQLIGATPYGGIAKLMISECRNFPELGQFYHAEVISRGYAVIERAVRSGIERGEFRSLDLDSVTRLVIAPLVLMAIWRHSFDFCDSHRLDPDAYIEHHIDLLLNGLIAGERVLLPAAANDARA